MAYGNGVISKPISTTDVISVIGSDNHDVGDLCVHENVNVYSKYKPMRHPTLSEMTKEQKIQKNWGYHVPNEIRMSNAVNYMIAEDANNGEPTNLEWEPQQSDAPYVYMHYGWWYERPQGGASSPYRLGDFNLYQQDTEQSLWWTSEIPSKITGAFDVDLYGQININDSNDVGTSRESGNIGSLYNKEFCVGFYGNFSVTGQANYTTKYKTGPVFMSGTYYHTVVHFTDDDIKQLIFNNMPQRAFSMYFMLVERNGNNISQNIDPNGTYYDKQTTYKQLSAKEFCIPLPIASKAVTYDPADTRQDPMKYFTSSSTGTISIMQGARARVRLTMTITNTDSADHVFSLANNTFEIHAHNDNPIGDVDTDAYTGKKSLTTSITGSTTVNAGATVTVVNNVEIYVGTLEELSRACNDPNAPAEWAALDYDFTLYQYVASDSTYYTIATYTQNGN